MSQQPRPPVLGRSFQELDQLAKCAVSRAVAQHHAAGRSTWFMAEGRLFEQRADGSVRPANPPTSPTAATGR